MVSNEGAIGQSRGLIWSFNWVDAGMSFISKLISMNFVDVGAPLHGPSTTAVSSHGSLLPPGHESKEEWEWELTPNTEDLVVLSLNFENGISELLPYSTLMMRSWNPGHI